MNLKNKKILVIDDVRVMNFECRYARTSKEAIDILWSDWTWDYVFFDHDLGGNFGALDVFDTVMPVVSWLEETIFYGGKPAIGTCVIHTANPAGRKILNVVLERHYPVRNVAASDYTVEILGYGAIGAPIPPTVIER